MSAMLHGMNMLAQMSDKELNIEAEELPIQFPEQMPEIDPQLYQRLEELITTIKTMHVPTTEDILLYLSGIHPLYAGILVVLGAIYLLWGLRLSKLLMTVNAAVVGAVGGGLGAIHFGYGEYWWMSMLGGAFVLALLVWPLMSCFAALIGGGIGAAVATASFEAVITQMQRPELMSYNWVAGCLGAVLLGLLVFAIFRVGIAILTAYQGAAMLAAGVLSLVFLDHSLREQVTLRLLEKPELLIFGLTGIFLAGACIQYFTKGHPKAKVQQDTQQDEQLPKRVI